MYFAQIKARIYACGIIFVMILISSCSTFKYMNQAPEVPASAYTIGNDEIIRIDLNKVKSLSEVGGSALLIDENLTNFLLIAHTAKDDYIVASSHCTHRGMALGYNHEQKTFRCSSLGHAKFKLDGTVISGPAKKPLKIYVSNVANDTLAIDLTL